MIDRKDVEFKWWEPDEFGIVTVMAKHRTPGGPTRSVAARIDKSLYDISGEEIDKESHELSLVEALNYYERRDDGDQA